MTENRINKPLSICETHTRDNWLAHEQYADNKDGTISCKLCSFGGKIPGYMKVMDGKIVDLRA